MHLSPLPSATCVPVNRSKWLASLFFISISLLQGASSLSRTHQVMDTPQMFTTNSERGRRLIGYAQMRKDVASLAECFSECMKMVPSCVSLNMAMSYTLHTSLYACELNGMTVDDDANAYIKDPNYTYYDIFYDNNA